MTTLVFPIEIENGIDMLDRRRQMSDDEFFYFCQENPDYTFERNPMAQSFLWHKRVENQESVTVS